MSDERRPSIVLNKACDLARAFLRWWLAELAAASPFRAQLLARFSKRCAILELRPGRFVLVPSDVQQTSHELQFPSDKPDFFPTLRPLSPCRPAPRTPLVLRVFPPYVLSTSLSLPLTAKPHIPQVLEFELDRITPFKPSDIYYTYRLAAEDTLRRQLIVHVFVAPRDLLDRSCRHIIDSGFRLCGVELETAHGLVNLPSARLAHAPPSRHPWLMRSALAGATSVLVFLSAFSIMLVLETGRLEDAVASKRSAVRAVLEQAHHSNAALRSVGFAADRNRLQSILPLVSSITSSFSDQTYLSSLAYHHPILEVEGISTEVAVIRQQLLSTGQFVSVEFRSPLNRVAGTGGERFVLHAVRVPQH